MNTPVSSSAFTLEAEVFIIMSYYKTKHWKSFSKYYLENYDCTCDICGRRRWTLYKRGKKKGKRRLLLRFNVHHLHYNSLYNESREDVLILCRFCHELLHKLSTANNIAPNIYGPLLTRLLENIKIIT
jgi:hypothetical protein